jgi:SNF2 family DNA or RNA helicase
MVSCCQNIFCGNCLLKWIKDHSTCPLCRQNVDKNKMIHLKKDCKIIIEDDSEDEIKEVKKDKDVKKSKPETVIDIVKSKPDGKFIVFSSHDASFDLVKPLFTENDLSFFELKGTCKTKERKLKEYREGDANIIFLNSKFNGAGINLEMTTDVILYHEMDEHIEKQVIARAMRIGRTNTLTIHRLY